MFNPMEMFQAQGEAGMHTMAQQLGLSTEQAARAMEALMPALTLGLQRGAGLDPAGFARIFGMPEAARSTAPQGLDALARMFGSAQLMQAVLQQASATSGVGSQVLRQMLPMMAGAVVASIVHVLLNQQPEPARPPAAPPPVPFPFSPIWAEMAKAFMPGADPGSAPASQPKPQAKPLQAKPSVDTASLDTVSPDKTPEPKPVPGGPDMLQAMFRTSAEVQGQNLKAMQELFESFWPNPVKATEEKGEAEAAAAPPPEPAAGAPAAGPAPAPAPPAPRPRRGRPVEG